MTVGSDTEANLPSFMRPTASSSKKARDKIVGKYVPRRLSSGLSQGSFGDSWVSTYEPTPQKKVYPRSLCVDSLPRYMQPTECSAKKMSSEKYKINPPRIPKGSLKNNMYNPKRELPRIQMSEYAMDPFVESLRRSSYYDRQANVGRRRPKTSLAGKRGKSLNMSKSMGDGRRSAEPLPSYQQSTIASSYREREKFTS